MNEDTINILYSGIAFGPQFLRHRHPSADIQIVVPDSAKTIGKVGFVIPPEQAGDNYEWPWRSSSRVPTPGGLRSLFPGRELRRIVVFRYLASATVPAPEKVRTALFELSRREIEGFSRSITWAEGNTWSIDARIEFSSGPSLRILTDGYHACLIDEADRRWCFWMAADEVVCGYETPEKALHRDKTNFCRFRDFRTTELPKVR